MDPFISPFVLYNWLQDSAISKLVIDVRPPDLYDIGYVKTAMYPIIRFPFIYHYFTSNLF